jgi:hypothetical protein
MPLASGLLIDRLVDASHLPHPVLARSVVQGHNLVIGPVKVIRHIGYLLKETV